MMLGELIMWGMIIILIFISFMLAMYSFAKERKEKQKQKDEAYPTNTKVLQKSIK